MRVIFAGTPEIAIPSFQAIIAAGHEICAVITRPDARAGRGKKLSASPVADMARDLHLPLLQPRVADDDFVAQVRALEADVAAVVAYGMLLPQALLDAVPGGWINLHFSLLPRWRGAAPVQHALLAGDHETGATTFRIVRALDAGPIYRTLTTRIEPHETTGDLLARLGEAGAPLLADTLADVAAGVEPVEQSSEGITLAPKVNPNDVRIDWTAPAAEINQQVRAANPEPGAWTSLGGEHFLILDVAPTDLRMGLAPGEMHANKRTLVVGTGLGALELKQVKPFGRKLMAGADWARGVQGGLPVGARFDD